MGSEDVVPECRAPRVAVANRRGGRWGTRQGERGGGALSLHSRRRRSPEWTPRRWGPCAAPGLRAAPRPWSWPVGCAWLGPYPLMGLCCPFAPSGTRLCWGGFGVFRMREGRNADLLICGVGPRGGCGSTGIPNSFLSLLVIGKARCRRLLWLFSALRLW